MNLRYNSEYCYPSMEQIYFILKIIWLHIILFSMIIHVRIVIALDMLYTAKDIYHWLKSKTSSQQQSKVHKI